MRRRFIDENGRIFGKISVIDVFVIIIAIVLVAAIYLKFNVKEGTSAVIGSDITYELTVYSARPSVLGSIKEGDTLYDANGNSVGSVTGIASAPATGNVQLTDGTLVSSELPDRVNIILSVTAPCSQSEGRYYANRTFALNFNSYNELHTKYYTFSAYITEIG